LLLCCLISAETLLDHLGKLSFLSLVLSEHIEIL
jgi:hypothetical protein